jgi:hypothetical protein
VDVYRLLWPIGMPGKKHNALGASPGYGALRKRLPHGGKDFGPVIVNIDGDETAKAARQR